MKDNKLKNNLIEWSRKNHKVGLLKNDYGNEEQLFLRGIVSKEEMESYVMELEARLKQILEEREKYGLGESYPVVNVPKNNRLFISYSSEDVDIAGSVYKYLQQCNVSAFWDTISMEAGEHIIGRLEKEIKASAFFLIIISGNSLRSPWVSMEAMLALMRGETENGCRTIPLVIDDRYYNDTLFIKEIMEHIDEVLVHEQQLMAERVNKGWGENVLKAKLDQYRTHRDNFENLILALKTLSPVNIVGENFEGGMERVKALIEK